MFQVFNFSSKKYSICILLQFTDFGKYSHILVKFRTVVLALELKQKLFSKFTNDKKLHSSKNNSVCSMKKEKVV